MDKISGIHPGNPIVYQRHTTDKSSDQFQQALERTMEKDTATTETTPSSPSPLGEIRPTIFTPIETHDSDFSTVAEKTDKLIALLDDYANDISDPLKSLKELAPLVDSIRNNAQELAEESQAVLPREKGSLHEIAMQCAVMAQVECIKFDRGDYV